MDAEEEEEESSEEESSSTHGSFENLRELANSVSAKKRVGYVMEGSQSASAAT